MNETCIDLRFSDARGHLRVLRATLVDGACWNLSAALDGGMFTRRCLDWQSVERTLFYLRHHDEGVALAKRRKPRRPSHH